MKKYLIKSEDNGDILISDKSNPNVLTLIAYTDSHSQKYNLSTISRSIAWGMSNLLKVKDILDDDVVGFYIVLDLVFHKWKVSSEIDETDRKHFVNSSVAQMAADLLNEYHEDNKIFGFTLKQLKAS